jgi:hypothetical protein
VHLADTNVQNMPAPKQPPNTGKPWTPEDEETLRRLAEADTPLGLIADQLGRRECQKLGALRRELDCLLTEASVQYRGPDLEHTVCAPR